LKIFSIATRLPITYPIWTPITDTVGWRPLRSTCRRITCVLERPFIVAVRV